MNGTREGVTGKCTGGHTGAHMCVHNNEKEVD